MKTVMLSVIDLALPCPRVGSIDTYSGFASTSKLAIKAHQKFQAAQHHINPNYQSEVATTHTMVFNRYKFHISGRMDGLYQENGVRIEEIKTAFDPKKLMDLLAEIYFTHPYWLQVQLYGYIYWLKTKTIPKLDLLILSLRNHKKTHTLSVELDIPAFELWLEQRFNELILEIKESQKRITRRKKLSKKLIFPFEQPRPHQKELIATITQGMEQTKPMLIQAPTGLGKTMGILYPALKESLGRGQKTIYITPKNTQHQIAFNTVRMLQDKGAPFKSLTLTSKKKLCMKNEPICTSKKCEFAENHYTKCTTHQILKQAQKKKNLNNEFFKSLAREYQVCPYEVQMECIPYVDVIIGDYNYVFSSINPRIAELPLGEEEKPNLVIDEVHNLPSRGMDYFSPELEVGFFENYLNALDRYPQPFQKKLIQIIIQCIETIHLCATPNVYEPHRVVVSEHLFKKQEEVLNQFLSDYLESDITIEEQDPILKLCNYWSDFTDALEFVNQDKDEFFISFHPRKNVLKISCCNASTFLQEHYLNYKQVVGFSATLKPFSYYSKLIGLNRPNLHTEEFATPFSQNNRKLLLIPQVSTKYKDRIANYSKIVEVITRISALKPGNYFVFFPSFEFLDQVYRRMPSLTSFALLRQTRIMHPGETHDLLQKLHQKEKHHLFFAVQGGMFAEGIDYVGDLAIGAFIVGPPLPSYDWEREEMKGYYEQQYQAGTEYAYIYPAMAKAVQAAGRVIRTETDKGIIVLMDNRFLKDTYSQCMPKDWFSEHPKELVSQSILKEIDAFWKER